MNTKVKPAQYNKPQIMNQNSGNHPPDRYRRQMTGSRKNKTAASAAILTELMAIYLIFTHGIFNILYQDPDGAVPVAGAPEDSCIRTLGMGMRVFS